MNGYLLDTHAALWWWTENPRLSATARSLIEDDDERILLSAASVWEVAIKSHAGRLPELPAFREEYPALMTANAFVLLVVTGHHVLEGAYLNSPHRDPFDRLIAGQARCEELVVVTRDPQFAGMGCQVLW